MGRQVRQRVHAPPWHVTDLCDGRTNGFSAAETGETLLVGGVNFGGGPLQVAEIIWYWSLLSDTDRQAVEAYLKAKWGTP